MSNVVNQTGYEEQYTMSEDNDDTYFDVLLRNAVDDSDDYQERRERLQPLILGLYQELSPREREILAYLSQDLTQEEIGRKIGAKQPSVHKSIAAIQNKVKKLVYKLGLSGDIMQGDGGKVRF